MSKPKLFKKMSPRKKRQKKNKQRENQQKKTPNAVQATSAASPANARQPHRPPRAGNRPRHGGAVHRGLDQLARLHEQVQPAEPGQPAEFALGRRIETEQAPAAGVDEIHFLDLAAGRAEAPENPRIEGGRMAAGDATNKLAWIGSPKHSFRNSSARAHGGGTATNRPADRDPENQRQTGSRLAANQQQINSRGDSENKKPSQQTLRLKQGFADFARLPPKTSPIAGRNPIVQNTK